MNREGSYSHFLQDLLSVRVYAPHGHDSSCEDRSGLA